MSQQMGADGAHYGRVGAAEAASAASINIGVDGGQVRRGTYSTDRGK